MATSEDSPYLPLLNEQIWKVGYGYERLTIPERVRLSYLRAQSIARHIDMTVEDIVNLSPKFWDFHSDCMPRRSSPFSLTPFSSTRPVSLTSRSRDGS